MIFTLIKYMVTLLAVLWPLQSFGQHETPAQLDDLIAEALERNPALHAAQHRWSAAQQQRPQASALDDPMFSYTRWVSTPETRVGPQENLFVLSQRFPYPGKLRLRGDMADEDAAAEEAAYRVTVRDVTFKVKQAYFDLYQVDQSTRVLDDYLELLRTFTRVAEEKYATGAGSQASVWKAQVEMSMIVERKLAFERARAGVVARLNALRDRPPASPIAAVTSIDTRPYVQPEPVVIQRALRERQELDILDARIRRNEIMTRLARLTYRPDFNVQASYITIPPKNSMAADVGKDAYNIMVGVNVPIRLHRRRAAVAEATALTRANEMARENMVNTIEAEIADAYFRVQSTRQSLDLYEQGLLPQAESSLESALAAYRTGQVDFLNLLDAERVLLQLRLSYVTEQANYRKHLATLEWAAGGALPE